MLEPQSSIVTIPTEQSRIQLAAGEDSLTEDYGEPSQNTRTMGGSVDFFSSLGTERVKKPLPNRPNPDKVRA